MAKKATRGNPYRMSKGRPTLRPSVVAFVDLLGYTEMVTAAVKDGKASAFLGALKRALDGGLKWVSPPMPDWGVPYDLYAVKVFTDNIVIGHPIHEDAEGELGRLFEQLAFFQLHMANRGFFLRGGVSIGDLYMDENIVYGPALIDAYVAERDHARDPRIVLTESAVAAVKRHLAYYGSARSAPQTREFFLDSDRRYFINYLDAAVQDEERPALYEVLRHKRRVQQMLTMHRGRPPIWSKYAWAAGYHNFFCRLNQYDRKYLVDLSKYQMTPSLIV